MCSQPLQVFTGDKSEVDTAQSIDLFSMDISRCRAGLIGGWGPHPSPDVPDAVENRASKDKMATPR